MSEPSESNDDGLSIAHISDSPSGFHPDRDDPPGITLQPPVPVVLDTTVPTWLLPVSGDDDAQWIERPPPDPPPDPPASKACVDVISSGGSGSPTCDARLTMALCDSVNGSSSISTPPHFCHKCEPSVLVQDQGTSCADSNHVLDSGREHALNSGRVHVLNEAKETNTADDGPQLTCFLDAAHANDLRQRRSTTGYAFMMSGGAVSYKCKTQPITATSSTEAEFYAAVTAAKHARYLRAILLELGFAQSRPTPMYCDNESAINMINHQIPTERARHIHIAWFAIQDWKTNGDILMRHIPGILNPSDDLTKPLGWILHSRHARRLMGHYCAIAPFHTQIFKNNNKTLR